MTGIISCTKGAGNVSPWNIERGLFHPNAVLLVPEPVTRGCGLVALVRHPADEKHVLLRVAWNRHDAMVGDLLKLIPIL